MDNTRMRAALCATLLIAAACGGSSTGPNPGSGTSGCGDTTGDPLNCGVCGNVCKTPENGTAQCAMGACTFTCMSGFHSGMTGCSPNDDSASCGPDGVDCQTSAPANSVATCDGTRCGFTCSSGYHQSGSSCSSDTSNTSCGPTGIDCTTMTPANGTVMCNGSSCEITCSLGYDLVGSACLSQRTVTSCGPMAIDCTQGLPAGATATCDGTSCAFNCPSGLHPSGETCASNSDPTSCTPAGIDCIATAPSGSTGACGANGCTFTCNDGYHAAGGGCVADTTVTSCGTEAIDCTTTAPANSMATCDGAECGFTCDPGFTEGDLPGGSDGGTTGGDADGGTLGCVSTSTCQSGTHPSGGMCVSNTNVTSCGPAGVDCTANVPANGASPACNGTMCTYSCESGYHDDGSTCASNMTPTSCGPAGVDCTATAPPHSQSTCNGTACTFVCNSGFAQSGQDCVVAPYVVDADTVVLDHLNGSTQGTIGAYDNLGSCNNMSFWQWPSIPPNSSYVAGPPGLGQGLLLGPPANAGSHSSSYLSYANQVSSAGVYGGESWTIEFWAMVTAYAGVASNAVVSWPVDVTVGRTTLLEITEDPSHMGACNDVSSVSFELDGQGVVHLMDRASGLELVNSGPQIMPLNTWTHLAMTAVENQNAYLYVNGNLYQSGSWPDQLNTTMLIRLGSDVGVASISELRVSSINRTQFNGVDPIGPITSCGTPAVNCVTQTPQNANAICSVAGVCGFTCNDGFRQSGNACVPAASVAGCSKLSDCSSETVPPNSAPVCAAATGTCSYACDAGYHDVGGACVADTTVGSCGQQAIDCTTLTPPNATASCDGTECGFSCATGFHPDGGGCVSDLTFTSCGPAGVDCAGLAIPAHSQSSCDGTECEFACNYGFQALGDACVTAPYVVDASTVLLDHFPGSTQGTIGAYQDEGACGNQIAFPSATPNAQYIDGPVGLGQALMLGPPPGSPSHSSSWLDYPDPVSSAGVYGGESWTIEFWTLVTAYPSSTAAGVSWPPDVVAAHSTLMEISGDPSLTAHCNNISSLSIELDDKGVVHLWDHAAGTELVNSGTQSLPLNVWTHLAVTAIENQTANLYMNANEYPSGAWPDSLNTTLLFRLGSDIGYAAIAELRVSSVIRTQFNGFDPVGASATSCGAPPVDCTASAPADATAVCNGGVCGFVCSDGFQEKAGVCVAVVSVTACGPSEMDCSQLSVPANSTPSCDATTLTCSFTCNPGFHVAGETCLADTDPLSCGSTGIDCTASPPGNATVSCDGTSCGFTCNFGFQQNGLVCLPDTMLTQCGSSMTNCIGTNPAHSLPACSGACTFICNTGFVQSGQSCVPAPYTADPNTLILDHFDGTTLATLGAYSSAGACSSAGTDVAATPVSQYVTGETGLGQALMLREPSGAGVNAASWLSYPDDVCNGTCGAGIAAAPDATVEFWVNLAAYPQSGTSTLFEIGVSNELTQCSYESGLSIEVDTAGVVHVWDHSQSAERVNSGTEAIPLGTWTHLAVTWAPMTLYVNSNGYVGTGSPDSEASLVFRLGSNVGNASIDELRVSNVVRTQFNGVDPIGQ